MAHLTGILMWTSRAWLVRRGRRKKKGVALYLEILQICCEVQNKVEVDFFLMYLG